MKRKIATILMFVLVLTLFAGCSGGSEVTERLYSLNSDTIYVDKEEGTMYVYVSGVKKAGLSIMLEPDGKPKIFNPETNTYKNVYYISSEDIYVDEEEGTMYLYVYGVQKAGLSVMYKADGMPKIYNPDTNTYNHVHSAYPEYVYVDELEGTMYLFVTGVKKGGLSVMLKADGMPKIYNNTSSSYKNVYSISKESVYVDNDGAVMYLFVSGLKKAGLSVMYSDDGSILTYHETEYYGSVHNISYDTIYVDEENSVKYLYVTGVEKAGLSVMYNSDGLPKIKN